MNDLLDAIAFELSELSVDCELVFDSFPNVDNATYVVIPHDFFSNSNAHLPSPNQLRRTIALCTERQGTFLFERTVKYARATGAAVHIDALGVRELRRRGVAAEHFQIGYTSRWDTWRGVGGSRPIDVLHLGAESPRRLRALASYATDLWDRDSRLLVPPVEGNTCVGETTAAMLARSKVVLDIRRDDRTSLEWALVVAAFCNGCVVVSESGRDAAPFLPAEHFISGPVGTLGMLARGLLDGPELEQLRANAYSFVTSSVPMTSSATRLAELAADLAYGRVSHRRGSIGLTTLAAADTARAVARSRARRLVRGAQAASGVRNPAQLAKYQAKRAARKRLVLKQIEIERASRRLELGSDIVELVEVARSSTYTQARPRVSVVVPLYNHENEVARALLSATRSSVREIEIVVLDDGSTDRSCENAREFLAQNQAVPALLLAHPVNRGLGPTRNALVGAARGEFVLPLDADNELYPSAVGKLLAALDDDTEAFFAYPILEVHVGGDPVGLLSYQPWEPPRLARGGYIDALALIRRDQLIELGGYTDDVRLYGWEDYDLWCRAAARGLYGVHVPEILARYARSKRSMLSITNHDHTEAFAILRERYPEVFALDVASMAEPSDRDEQTLAQASRSQGAAKARNGPAAPKETSR